MQGNKKSSWKSIGGLSKLLAFTTVLAISCGNPSEVKETEQSTNRDWLNHAYDSSNSNSDSLFSDLLEKNNQSSIFNVYLNSKDSLNNFSFLTEQFFRNINSITYDSFKFRVSLEQVNVLNKNRKFLDVDSIRKVLSGAKTTLDKMNLDTASEYVYKYKLAKLKLLEKDNLLNSYSNGPKYIELSNDCITYLKSKDPIGKKDSLLVASIYHHLLSIHYQLRNFEEADKASIKEEAFLKSAPLKLVALKHDKAIIYSSIEENAKSIQQCKETLELANNMTPVNYVALFYAYSAFHEYYLYENEDSLKYFSKKLYEIKSKLPRRLELESLLYIVEHVGPKKGIELMDQEKEEYMSTLGVEQRQSFYYVRADMFEKMKDYKSCMENYVEAININHSVMTEKKKAQIVYLEKKFDLAKKQQTIAENGLKIKSIELEKKRLSYIIGVSIFVLIIGILLSAFFIKLKAKRKEVQMQEKHSENLLKTTEEMQRKIANDLHDQVGHDLLSIKILLQRKDIEPIPDIVTKSLSGLSDIVRLIYPVEIETLSTKELIENLLDRFRTICDIDFVEKIEDIKLPKEHNLTIYRIIQESIDNSIKYSSCSKVQVELYSREDEITLSIVDNGKGFNPKEVKNSFGLQMMKQRVNSIQGTLTIKSNPNAGTKTNLKLPNAKKIINHSG